MNRIGPKKLHHSKWTAAEPRNKEKHFLVSEVIRDQDGTVLSCVLEAIHSKRELEIAWRELQDSEVWLVGWN